MKENKIRFAFYAFIGIFGFLLLIVDTTPGHRLTDHLGFFKENLDAVEGVIFIFFSGFEIGKLKQK